MPCSAICSRSGRTRRSPHCAGCPRRTRAFVRNGEPASVLATEVVPGDILLVEEGDTVAADARLIESTALCVAEAPLTGESLPVSKDIQAITGDTALGDRANMVYSGTSIAYGRGRAVVTATGTQTEMGRIAGLVVRQYLIDSSSIDFG